MANMAPTPTKLISPIPTANVFHVNMVTTFLLFSCKIYHKNDHRTRLILVLCRPHKNVVDGARALRGRSKKELNVLERTDSEQHHSDNIEVLHNQTVGFCPYFALETEFTYVDSEPNRRTRNQFAVRHVHKFGFCSVRNSRGVLCSCTERSFTELWNARLWSTRSATVHCPAVYQSFLCLATIHLSAATRRLCSTL